jgi:hypothetical protein
MGNWALIISTQPKEGLMQIQGTVLGVKDGSYKSKKDNSLIPQLNIDVYDATSGLQPCTLAGAGAVPPQLKTDIVADVVSIRKINFGVGYVLALANVRPAVAGTGAPTSHPK